MNAESSDAAIARLWPAQWAKANNQALPHRSKARQKLRARYREHVANEAFRAANPRATCRDCSHSRAKPDISRDRLVCDLDSDFSGYAMVEPLDWCRRFLAASADTHPKGGDSPKSEAPAPLSGAVPAEERADAKTLVDPNPEHLNPDRTE